jgi:hypothetical protein
MADLRVGTPPGEDAVLVGGGQAGGVDGDEHVGRAVRPFVADALEELFFLAFDAVDLDAGAGGEVGVEGLVGLVVTGGVEVEFGVGGESGIAQGGAGGQQGGEGFQLGHGRVGADKGGRPEGCYRDLLLFANASHSQEWQAGHAGPGLGALLSPASPPGTEGRCS